MGDVNGLKLVNDSFGHTAGDALLMKVASVMQKGCRADDILARLGGDEFIIILPQTDASGAESVIQRIKDLLIIEKVGTIDLSVSFGYEIKQQTNENMQEIFKNAEDHLYRHKLYESLSMRSQTISLVLNTLFEKNQREMMHSKRVGEIAELIAVKLGLSEEDVRNMKTAGSMHDIGKIGIDEAILNKPSQLTDSEREEMQRHPEIGYRILSSVSEFSEIAVCILEHHERWDGTGYPRGLKGNEICLEARILAIADAYDAMTSNRTYHPALNAQEALAEIHACEGTQFDPKIVRLFTVGILGETKV
jgi:diguanylate cyclase (GGDEF)-like protein/putative nucleotidyltransferase with HDIG domain